MHSVGEIFVLPTNPDETNSGILGILYQVELTTLSTEDILISDNIEVYPNPTKDKLFISLQSDNLPEYIKVYNTTGQEVFSGKLTTNQNSFDLSVLPNGIYFVRFSDNESKSYKIIKQ